MHLRETGKKRQHAFLLKGLSFRLLFLPLSLFPFLLSSLSAGEGIGSFELLAPSHGQALGFCSVLGPGKTGSVDFAFRGAGLWNPPPPAIDLLIHASCLLPFRQDFSSYKVYGSVLYLAISFLLVNLHQAAFKASRQMECP